MLLRSRCRRGASLEETQQRRTSHRSPQPSGDIPERWPRRGLSLQPLDRTPGSPDPGRGAANQARSGSHHARTPEPIPRSGRLGQLDVPRGSRDPVATRKREGDPFAGSHDGSRECHDDVREGRHFWWWPAMPRVDLRRRCAAAELRRSGGDDERVAPQKGGSGAHPPRFRHLHCDLRLGRPSPPAVRRTAKLAPAIVRSNPPMSRAPQPPFASRASNRPRTRFRAAETVLLVAAPPSEPRALSAALRRAPAVPRPYCWFSASERASRFSGVCGGACGPEAVLLVRALPSGPRVAASSAAPAVPRPYSWLSAFGAGPESRRFAAASPRSRGRTAGSALPSGPRLRPSAAASPAVPRPYCWFSASERAPSAASAAASPAVPRPYSWFSASERAPSAASAAASPAVPRPYSWFSASERAPSRGRLRRRHRAVPRPYSWFSASERARPRPMRQLSTSP